MQRHAPLLGPDALQCLSRKIKRKKGDVVLKGIERHSRQNYSVINYSSQCGEARTSSDLWYRKMLCLITPK